MFLYDIVVFAPGGELYTYKSQSLLLKGTKVTVPFGKTRVIGVVWAIRGESSLPKDLNFDQILTGIEVIDCNICETGHLLEMAAWMSHYYAAPKDITLKTVFPLEFGKTNRPKKYQELTPLGKEEMEGNSLHSMMLKEYFKRKKRVIESSLRKKNCPINKLTELGYIRATYSILDVPTNSRADQRTSMECGQAYEFNAGIDNRHSLTPAQLNCLNEVNHWIEKASGNPILLWGITGAGKTEIYVHLIHEALLKNPNAQSLVMVPEISLTPQATEVFTNRFPNLVAVVHSAMSPKQRRDQLENIKRGYAKILIGPRSSIFAPFTHLKLIIVDEEHDSSYKQTTGVCYNGRDMAVVRGRLAAANVVLGSATPSLESFYNAQIKKYDLVTLTERVRGRLLPHVTAIEYKSASKSRLQLVDNARKESNKLPIHPEIIRQIQSNLESKQQTIIIVNRRGYSYFLVDSKNGQPVKCPHCSISLTTHHGDSELRCHYCDYRVKTSTLLKDPKDSFVPVGYGSEQAALYFQSIFPDARIARVDSDVISHKEVLEGILDRFRSGDIDLLVGTQMLAKGHDFPGVTLTVLLEVDQLLSLPDFRVGERTFQLMVQAAGRSGRHEAVGNVLVQTSRLDSGVVQSALKQDYLSFVKHELGFRKMFGYPPFSKVANIEFSSEDEQILDNHMKIIEKWVASVESKTFTGTVRFLGPSIPAIAKIRKRHRRSLLLLSARPSALREILTDFVANISVHLKSIRVLIDRDPQALL